MRTVQRLPSRLKPGGSYLNYSNVRITERWDYGEAECLAVVHIICYNQMYSVKTCSQTIPLQGFL